METENRERKVFPMNAIRLCIDQCGDDLRGRAYSKLCIRELKFESFGEFLLKTDELFDECGYPQSFEEKRDFFSKKPPGSYRMPKAVVSDEKVLSQKGKKYTADVFVKSRRRTGWQGFLVSEEGSLREEYHSEMELLHLICSVTGWKIQ